MYFRRSLRHKAENSCLNLRPGFPHYQLSRCKLHSWARSTVLNIKFSDCVILGFRNKITLQQVNLIGYCIILGSRFSCMNYTAPDATVITLSTSTVLLQYSTCVREVSFRSSAGKPVVLRHTPGKQISSFQILITLLITKSSYHSTLWTLGWQRHKTKITQEKLRIVVKARSHMKALY
jgi:hypothetical protein